MSWKDFYSNPDLKDGFGSRLGNRRNPHRGLDFAHGAGTPIPTYVEGVVVTNDLDSALGNIIEVQTPDGRFVGYRHMLARSPLSVGDRASIGQIVGLVGNTGSASEGNHLCTTNASGKGGVYGISGLVDDPWPRISAALSAGDPASTAPARRKRKELTVIYSFIKNPAGAIYLLNGETRKRRGLNWGEWLAYSVQGYTFADLSQADFDETLARFTD